jgi:hypothetical protein
MAEPEEFEFHHVYDLRFEAEANHKVAAAMASIKPSFHGNDLVDRKRRAREWRISASTLDREVLKQIVAQWLSAKDKASLKGALPAAQEVSQIKKDAEKVAKAMASLAETLRFAPKGDAGHSIADYAEVAAAAMQEAMQALGFAKECADKIIAQLPRAPGKDGGLGKLINRSPDRALSARDWALAEDLSGYWLASGLSLKAGEVGDGLDFFLGSLLGSEESGRKALAVARKSRST